MSFKKKSRLKAQHSQFEKIEIPVSLAGLARTHRMIRTEKDREIQFMKLCSQILLDDFKQKRSERQRNERRLKRSNNFVGSKQND